MKNTKYFLVTIVLFISILLATQFSNVNARSPQATAPNLGVAGSFSVLGFSEVTNSGPTYLSSGIGVWSGSSISGLADITVGGTTNQTDTIAQQAQIDASAAVGTLSGQANTGGNLGALDNLTLQAGVYDMGAGSLGGGVLTLDGEGVYIFRASSSLTTAGSVNLINGARACDVYWYVPDQATLTSGSFVGTIIAGAGVVLGTGVSLDGRALAIGGPVTLLSNSITGPSCPSPATNNAQSESTATPLSVSGLPDSGGAPIQNETSPWSLLLIIGGFIAIAAIAGSAVYRNSHRLQK
jgi:hypothetical protein